jgi:hypothetical protein
MDLLGCKHARITPALGLGLGLGLGRVPDKGLR